MTALPTASTEAGRRPPTPLLAAATGVVAASGLISAAIIGRGTLAGAVFLLQVVLALGWLALVDAPGDAGGFALVGSAAITADIVLFEQSGVQVGDLAAIVGIALPGAFLHQLLRRRRRDVTASLIAVVMLVVLAASAASLIGLRGGRGGQQATVAALLGLGASILAGRTFDRFVPRPALAPGASRGFPGLIAGLVAGTTAAALYGSQNAILGAARGAAFGIVVAAVAAAADVGVDLGAAEMAGLSERQRSAVDPVAALLPFALAAPAAYVVGRLLLG